MSPLHSFTLLKLLFVFIGSFAVIDARNNGLGLTPPLGWNTWCSDGWCARDYCFEEEIREVAEVLVSSGMKQLGWEYIVLDDCWGGPRDAAGHLTADVTRFPNGMKAVADYVHSKGLKFGLYTSAGLTTCFGGRPGSYGHYQDDANTLASWTVDYVKMDWCDTVINGTEANPQVLYKEMGDALNATGRPIFFAICGFCGDGLKPTNWQTAVANSWRLGNDHHDEWLSPDGTAYVIQHFVNESWRTGPGGWSDADFIMTGGEECFEDTTQKCPGQSPAEYNTEMSMWSIFASPLFVATDIRYMNALMKDILLNSEVLAVNQDKLGKGGDLIWSGGAVTPWGLALQVWSRPLSDGTYAVALLNKGEVPNVIVFDFSWINWKNATVQIRDLWKKQDLGSFKNSFSSNVEVHATVLLKVKKL